MRPSTPNLNVSSFVGPSSPPHTPTAASHPPSFIPKISSGPGAGPADGVPPQQPPTSMSQPPNVMPLGNGQFTYTCPVRPMELSPRSSDSSGEGSQPEADLSDNESSPCSPPPSSSARQPDLNEHFASQTRLNVKDNFLVEELSDFDEDDMEGRDDVIRPSTIEDAESERSQSATQLAPDDPQLDRHFQNLHCRSPGLDLSSDEFDLGEDAHQEMIRRTRAADRQKRMSQSSVGKRTISERESDSDHEDVRNYLNFDELGSSARRLKRRTGPGNRGSLIFQDPPPRIDEDTEPEELEDTELKELPFYEYTSMEVDSPKSS